MLKKPLNLSSRKGEHYDTNRRSSRTAHSQPIADLCHRGLYKRLAPDLKRRFQCKQQKKDSLLALQDAETKNLSNLSNLAGLA